MDVPLKVDITEGVDAVRVSVCGELDMWTSVKLQEVFDTVQGDEHKLLELDLGEVTFLDSEGIKTLVGGHRSLKDRNVTLSITACSRCVARILTLSGVDGLLCSAARDDLQTWTRTQQGRL